MTAYYAKMQRVLYWKWLHIPFLSIPLFFTSIFLHSHRARERWRKGGVGKITANAHTLKTFDLMFIVYMYYITFSKCLPSTKAFFIHMKTKTDTASIKSMFAVSDPGKGNKIKI